MKKALSVLCVALLSVITGNNAWATPVTFDVDGPTDSWVNITDMETGVSMDLPFVGSITIGENTSITASLDPSLSTLPNFELNDNESYGIDFFTLSVAGSGIGSFSLNANLNFDAPVIDMSGTGDGGWGTVTIDTWIWKGTISAGAFFWDNAVQEFKLSDGNIIKIALDDGFALGVGDTKTVKATVTNLGGAVAPVPEPATLMLLGSGLIGLAGFRRRNNK